MQNSKSFFSVSFSIRLIPPVCVKSNLCHCVFLISCIFLKFFKRKPRKLRKKCVNLPIFIMNYFHHKLKCHPIRVWWWAFGKINWMQTKCIALRCDKSLETHVVFVVNQWLYALLSSSRGNSKRHARESRLLPEGSFHFDVHTMFDLVIIIIIIIVVQMQLRSQWYLPRGARTRSLFPALWDNVRRTIKRFWNMCKLLEVETNTVCGVAHESHV